ncbi:MAG: hypothetical protein PWP23_705, partial [Candidatus Sumerlaeota bacterium]|nr:hypothetical protein [Candidatus Sumerlaeota bacterium]
SGPRLVKSSPPLVNNVPRTCEVLPATCEAQSSHEVKEVEEVKYQVNPKAHHRCATRTESFSQFWTRYPRKQRRKEAQAAWKKLAPDDETVKQIFSALEEDKTSTQWTKDGGRFVPSAARWLDERRWEDEQDADGKPRAGCEATAGTATMPGAWAVYDIEKWFPRVGIVPVCGMSAELGALADAAFGPDPFAESKLSEALGKSKSIEALKARLAEERTKRESAERLGAECAPVPAPALATPPPRNPAASEAPPPPQSEAAPRPEPAGQILVEKANSQAHLWELLIKDSTGHCEEGRHARVDAIVRMADKDGPEVFEKLSELRKRLTGDKRPGTLELLRFLGDNPNGFAEGVEQLLAASPKASAPGAPPRHRAGSHKGGFKSANFASLLPESPSP